MRKRIGVESGASSYTSSTNYNGIQGDNFQVFYNQSNSPTRSVPTTAEQMPGILAYTLAD